MTLPNYAEVLLVLVQMADKAFAPRISLSSRERGAGEGRASSSILATLINEHFNWASDDCI